MVDFLRPIFEHLRNFLVAGAIATIGWAISSFDGLRPLNGWLGRAQVDPTQTVRIVGAGMVYFGTIIFALNAYAGFISLVGVTKPPTVSRWALRLLALVYIAAIYMVGLAAIGVFFQPTT